MTATVRGQYFGPPHTSVANAIEDAIRLRLDEAAIGKVNNDRARELCIVVGGESYRVVIQQLFDGPHEVG